MSGSLNIERRRFLQKGALASGGLIVGFHWSLIDEKTVKAEQHHPTQSLKPNAFVTVTSDNFVIVTIGHSELGQGTLTAMAMMVAEDLDADWKRVRWEQAPADPAYNQPVFHTQITGASMSTGAEYKQQREAGAVVRSMIVSAAAKQWNVDITTLKTESSKVIHTASNRSATYGEMVAYAQGLPVPPPPALKDPKEFKIIGKPLIRIDAREKVNGTAKFGMDVYLPNMLTAVRLRPPVFGGKVQRIDATKAKALHGIVGVFEIPTGVAVIAKDFWIAQKGREALIVDWDLSSADKVSTTNQRAAYTKLFDAPGAIVTRNDGDVSNIEKSSSRKIVAEYSFPYLAHVPMEPENAVIDLRDDRCDVWIGTQWQTGDQLAVAGVTGLKQELVKIHTMFIGGGFGRRTNPPIPEEAAQVAKAARAAGIKAPIKLVWTREDDVKGGFYRPFVHARLTGTLDAQNQITSWDDIHVAQMMMKGTAFESILIRNGVDTQNTEGAEDMPYAIPNVRFAIHQPESGVKAWWWRSVGHSFNGFIVETFIDELAHAAGKDPYRFRRDLLKHKPRHLDVLDTVAKASGWETPPPPNIHRGIAVHESYGSFVAQVIEVEVGANRELKIHRVVMAIDCGIVINPNLVHAQMESAIVFGLSGALFQEITLKDGVVEQNNFDDYPVLRMYQTPKIEVHIVNSNEPPSGCGEPGVECVAPALVNAIFAATGERIHSLPLKNHNLKIA